ncbi:hypothetical protein A3D85_02970 [Candidatus Amesbacteria bacterium RIFCSPHIGHO2_02_FULL_47_9]|uniref:Metal-dependent hydrolase n=1 Tax=Candidatus Amesbacteria bacterium RIFCSPHIGHO2_01_FULL_48_32b TaxID=1797253 RepID=A0A1F4YES6_9BACT|nr:MAG: hypothetical protein A2876_04185 [Candidatus Amesbacteria bacterium RIFCSPHIGHO2_01_FULL_48_32b]OGD05056.1 MAG: hypothetical protein A3D85_02970 [Candidatus Amesbacteria bacterium RIFCSPHIGHO2_02_FULL_47_9]OGD08598.1 MAG: hypothetical protein A2899_02455 [Candidatus Amesbacteria bacterium RIFCSPLOWO2_01_FULL_49_25]
MTFVTHILVVAAGVQLLGLEGLDAMWAYVFGVAVDLDHAVKVPAYINRIGWKRKKHYNWRTSLQEPVSLLWVVPFSIAVRSAVPSVFFVAHMTLDYLVSYEKRPFWPFSGFVTKGIWLGRSDKLKEIVVAAMFGCINLLLWSTSK